MTRLSVNLFRSLGLVCAVACAALPSAAQAVSCSVSTRAANFGVYNPLQATPLSTTAAIDVACTCTVLDCVAFGYRIEVSGGQSGSTAAREMAAQNGRLRYNLYSDPAFTTVWGTGSAGYGALYLIALFGSKQVLTAYARIPAGQTVPAGSYTDSPVVTIVY